MIPAFLAEATGAPLGREDGCNQGPRFFRQIRVVPLITDQLQLQNRTFQTLFSDIPELGVSEI